MCTALHVMLQVFMKAVIEHQLRALGWDLGDSASHLHETHRVSLGEPLLNLPYRVAVRRKWEGELYTVPWARWKVKTEI